MQEYNTAAFTKINTREALARLEKEEMPRVMSEIATAANRGMFYVTTIIRFKYTIGQLKGLGYKVKPLTSVAYDAFYEINWE